MSSAAHARSSPAGIWREAVASSFRVDWSRFEPLPALRCTLGVAIPLIAAVLLGQAAAGMFVAIGAVAAGFGSFQGAYRSRAATMLFATVGMAVSLFVGSISGHSTTAVVVAAGVAGFTAGLLVALGPAAAFVAVQSAVAVLVAGAFAAPVGEAALRAMLVLGGGLVQILLVVSLWPLRTFRSERDAVAQVYRSLAEYAARLPQATSPPEPHSLVSTGGVHLDPQPFAESKELLVFHALLDEAERIRSGLAALSLGGGDPSATVAPPLSAVLQEIADAIDQSRAPGAQSMEWHVLDAAAEDPRDTSGTLRAILRQARAAYRLAATPAVEDPTAGSVRVQDVRPHPVRDALLTLRANVSLQSAAFRHAIRLALALALATAIYRATELPRGYWFPMATLLVLKPQFRETFVAGITRTLGTLAGAGLAALLVETIGTHPYLVATLLLGFVWSGYAVFRANFTLFTVCITGYIVLLLYLANVPGEATAIYRALNTTLGGALALTIYRLWPTWESARVPEVLATELDALAGDTELLFRAYADPARREQATLRQTRAAARLARSNAEASVERAVGEPASPESMDPEVALSLVAAIQRYALGALALHARLESRPPPAPQLSPLGEEIVATLRRLARTLRDGGAPGPLAPLREAHAAVIPALEPAVAEHTGVLVESVSTIGRLLTRAR